MLKNPFAISSDGSVVHIDNVEGTTGPYICAGCGDSLSKVSASKPYTRKGSDKVIQTRGHFKHKHQDECETGLETSLHLWGKMIIEEAMTVGLPDHYLSYKEVEQNFRTDWNFTSVTLEEWQDGIRPDVVLHHPDGRLNVEIRVSHAVDENKAKLLQERSQSCIEIDLSDFDFDKTPGAELCQAILYDAPRNWIVHQLEEDRIAVLKSEWLNIAQKRGNELRETLKCVPTLITNATRDKHESEIKDLGHEPFIGREMPRQHWFVAPPRNWQHVALMVFLHPMAQTNGEYHYDRPPRRFTENIHVFRNESLPQDIDPDILHAAGLTTEFYGSHRQAVADYFRMLCEEPDIENVHPIVRRIVSHGSTPGTMVMNPERASYLSRRNELRNAYKEAGRRRQLGDDDFRVWYVRPLSAKGITPKRICVDGGMSHARLIAHMHAIKNMLDGGWPVEHLLGVEEQRFRNKQAKAYNRPIHSGGGPHPYYQGTHKVCASTRLMREGKPISDILTTMASKLHKSPEDAEAFLQTPNRWIENTRPLDFATDIPTLQRCISLMPTDPSRRRKRWGTYKRIW